MGADRKAVKAFTIYWTPEGWSNIPEGTPIKAAGGTGYKSKVPVGSRVYVSNVKDGQLRLLGGFTVKSIADRSKDGKPPAATWDAPEYLLAEDNTSSPLSIRLVPLDVVKALRFVSPSGAESSVALDADGRVNGQAMRASPRELTPESAALLEAMLDTGANFEWTLAELRASVVAYLDMAARLRRGEPVVKKDCYRALAKQFGRTEKAFEYRMQNISYVLSLMGREWLPGLVPAKNVGAKVAAQIEQLIADVEGHPVVPKVGAEVAAREAQKVTPKVPPKGKAKPAAGVASVTVYERDPQVRAWVLTRAAGVCEACRSPAPFVMADNQPFLEVHHVRQLADGGSDQPSNAVALCPNCHRRLHYGKDAKAYRDGLFVLVQELVPE